MNRVISFYVVLLCFCSCHYFNNSSVDLGNNYAFIDNKYITSRNVYTGTDIFPKVIDYELNDRFIIVKQRPDIDEYRSYVSENLSLRFEIFDSFIKERDTVDYTEITTPFILKSIKADSLLYFKLKKNGVSTNNEQNSEKINNYVDSVFIHNLFYKKVFSSKLNYWIIDKEKNVRFGPYNKNEFEKEKRKKNINLSFH